MSGFIKIHRKILDWEWFTEPNTLALFMYLLLTCNYKKTRWRGVDLEVGEIVQSLDTISQGSGLSIQSVRTSVERLKSTGELTQRQHGKFRILKVKNFKSYQLSNIESTANQHRINIESTVDKEVKKLRKKEVVAVEKKYKKKKIEKPANVSLSIWQDFLDHRKAKKSPVTQTVLTRIDNEARKINWTLERAMEEMCARGWQGFNADWIEKEKVKAKEHVQFGAYI